MFLSFTKRGPSSSLYGIFYSVPSVSDRINETISGIFWVFVLKAVSLDTSVQIYYSVLSNILQKYLPKIQEVANFQVIISLHKQIYMGK